MPYLITHTSFGKDVLDALKTGLPCTPLFYLGCLGPDPFFFDAFPPTPFRPHQMQLGRRMHETDAAVLFSALTEHAEQRHVPFLCGMLCHLALDAAAHPYVTAVTHGYDHTRLEIAIDMRLFPRQTRTVGMPFSYQKDADAALADALMAGAARTLFGVDVKGAYLRGVRKLGGIVIPLSYDASGRKLRAVTAVERMIRKPGAVSGFLLSEGRPDEQDVCNTSHRDWAAPNAPDRVRNEDFAALYQSAVPHAVTLISAYRNGGRDALIPLLTGYTMSRGAPV